MVEFGIRIGLLISIPNICGYHNCVCQQGVINVMCVLGLGVFCLVHGGSDKMREMRNSDPAFKELKLHPWLCCKGFHATYCATYSDTLEGKKSRDGVPDFRQRLRKTCRQRTHSEESTLRRDSKSATLWSEQGWYSTVMMICFGINFSPISFDSIVIF